MNALRTRLCIGVVCAALIGCFALLGRIALVLIADGRPATVALATGLLVLPLAGLLVAGATMRTGFTHQKLVRLAGSNGMDLDVGALPRRASGRIERAAADELFHTVRAELDADPDNWIRWYRLARAYDYAGDRGRARDAMKKAALLQECRCPGC